MSIEHGVTIQEVPTSVLPARRAARVPVVVGTAPTHRGSLAATPLEPVIAYSYEEAVARLGYSTDWEKYTLCEVMYALFQLYRQGPVVFINVFDPAADATDVTDSADLVNGRMTLLGEPILSTLVITDGGYEPEEYELGVDYTAAYDNDGNIVITRLATGSIPAADSTLALAYSTVATSTGITTDDIIGGVDALTGARTGLELIEEVYPRWRAIPGMILAPGWSDDAEVSAIMVAKGTLVSGIFRCIAITDANSSTVTDYADVNTWKAANGLDDPRLVVCWPQCTLGEKQYHLSTHVAGVMLQTDANNNDIPFVSPSNKAAQMNGLVLADGTPVYLTRAQANALESVGVVTALNWEQWVIWGNRTSAYPTTTDPKDAFICERRMFDYVGNAQALIIWQRLDFPIVRRTIQDVTDSCNHFLNGLVGSSALYGGRTEFLQDDNPVVSIMDGQVTFTTSLGTVAPMANAVLKQQFDARYVQMLYSEGA